MGDRAASATNIGVLATRRPASVDAATGLSEWLDFVAATDGAPCHQLKSGAITMNLEATLTQATVAGV